ncbi:MAG: hypothetical protein ABSH19_05725, partial [Opitutales bacterium]
ETSREFASRMKFNMLTIMAGKILTWPKGAWEERRWIDGNIKTISSLFAPIEYNPRPSPNSGARSECSP